MGRPINLAGKLKGVLDHVEPLPPEAAIFGFVMTVAGATGALPSTVSCESRREPYSGIVRFTTTSVI
jgi:hypothetical protein